jgi:hypothetical protein
MIAAFPLLLMKWLRAVPWQAWALLALCGLLWAFGHWRYNAGQAEVQSRWDAAEAVHAANAKAAKDAAAIIETRMRADYAAAAARFNKENADALAERDAVIAGLRAGTVRVRERFRCPPARLPEAAPGSGGSDGAGEGGLLPEDAGFLLRLAGEADTAARRLTACQAIIRSQP